MLKRYKKPAQGFSTARQKPAEGFTTARKKCQRGVNCFFDDETFDQIRELCLKEETSFAEQIRQLVEIGLEEKNAQT